MFLWFLAISRYSSFSVRKLTSLCRLESFGLFLLISLLLECPLLLEALEVFLHVHVCLPDLGFLDRSLITLCLPALYTIINSLMVFLDGEEDSIEPQHDLIQEQEHDYEYFWQHVIDDC